MISILEARPGQARHPLLQEILRSHEPAAARNWPLDFGFESGGVWAGVQELFAGIVEEIRLAGREDLLRRHDLELLQVLPGLEGSLHRRYPTLTDLASGEEKVRGYPADRAFRSIHGLIDLLAEWKGADDRPWVIVCDHCDSASRIGRHFLLELARRRGAQMNLRLVLVTAPGKGQDLQALLPLPQQSPIVTLQLPDDTEREEPMPVDAKAIWELDRGIGNDPVLIRSNLAKMIRLWAAAGNEERLLKWNLLGLESCTDCGLYEDALVYGGEARRLAQALKPEDGALRWMIFFKLFSCHMALRDPEAALALAEADAIGRTERAEWRSQLDYLLAMLHGRYLPARDFDKAEALLQRGMEEIEAAGLPKGRRHFAAVFNRNGLAMIRHFQGRFEEAIDLCRASFERLSTHLAEERHRLHRSVLLFNLAQVYAVTGHTREALAHYSAAIAMDPNYSEYYNDRGSLLLKSGDLEGALSDYGRAIELSPPYFEVFTNLGQCCRRMGRLEDADEAYSRALDLEPRQPLALLGRAQVRESQGAVEGAIADYTQALDLVPGQWEALANRAVLLYETGRFQESLADLEEALRLAPEQAYLYSNRAVVRTELGQLARAESDLETYLALRPDCPDRAKIEDQLSRLRLPASA